MGIQTGVACCAKLYQSLCLGAVRCKAYQRKAEQLQHQPKMWDVACLNDSTSSSARFVFVSKPIRWVAAVGVHSSRCLRPPVCWHVHRQARLAREWRGATHKNGRSRTLVGATSVRQHLQERTVVVEDMPVGQAHTSNKRCTYVVYVHCPAQACKHCCKPGNKTSELSSIFPPAHHVKVEDTPRRSSVAEIGETRMIRSKL